MNPVNISSLARTESQARCFEGMFHLHSESGLPVWGIHGAKGRALYTLVRPPAWGVFLARFVAWGEEPIVGVFPKRGRIGYEAFAGLHALLAGIA